jgi:hypothetical protein
MTRQFLGISARRWIEYLVAIVLGNLIYYFSLEPHLPDTLRHHLMKTDAGSVVDFVTCVAVYVLLRIGSRI